MEHYVHHVRGRLRIKLPGLINNPSGYQKVHDMVKADGSFEISKVNPITGSVVISYDSDRITHKEILDNLAQIGLLDPSKIINNDQYVKNAISKFGNTINKTLTGAFLGSALDGTPLSFLAALI
ncbi:MAG: hypothetical protein HQK88_14715 [Nitrospirae bacterium]|nr:hypothetical protein [Nitrospirota bacterium]MBF0521180.1 hypothetical protein [Nitrospirota bacterium]MBF0535973.1 hypothetical protein [Nitrospirota bacterium]MBF0618051.1 hypothetical protein [Nitrospirota bacterium]